MKKVAYLVLVLLALPAFAQTVYRWVDKQGVVHYSDEPHQGAKQVQLGSATVLPFKVPAQEGDQPQTAPQPGTAAMPSYQVKVLAPAPGTTIWPVNYIVHASVQVTPPPGGRALLKYELDGKMMGKPTPSTSVQLKPVYRGTHTLTVTLLGPNGETLATGSSKFYARQHSILHPGRPRARSGGGGGG